MTSLKDIHTDLKFIKINFHKNLEESREKLSREKKKKAGQSERKKDKLKETKERGMNSHFLRITVFVLIFQIVSE